jgi:hypothetical protein
VPRAESGLHAEHERIVRESAVDELLPELVDRMVALCVGGTQKIGRCGRVSRRPSHEWSIGIIRAQGKGNAVDI